ncbi:MAG: glycosyltransferase [Nocardioidaceae bacterium]
MRVVVSCVPQAGHVLPVLPLAEALAAQGHEVVVAVAADAADLVAGRGVEFRPVGTGLGDWFAELRARTRGTPGDGLAPDRVEGYFVPRLFGEIGAARVVDDLFALCRELEPTHLIFDPYAFAAPLVAALTGAHPVLHTISPLSDPGVLDLVGDAVSPLWREFGVDVPPAAGVYAGTTLTICPPSLDPASTALAGAQPLRPVPPPLADPPPPPVGYDDPGRPLVYLTLGTFSNNHTGLFRLVIEALADEPVNLVATIGPDNDPAAFAPLPANARVERFIPQGDLLPHCAAVVHHAGAGTTFGALGHGLPAVAVPQSADNFDIAKMLVAAGVAERLQPGEVTVDAVRSALRRVLHVPDYRERARHIAEEMAGMPSPTEVAAKLGG